MFNTGGLIVILPYAISESTDTLPGVFSNIHKHCVYHRWLHINHETITFFSGNKLVCSAWYAGYRPLSVTLGALFPHLFFLIYWCTVLVRVRGKKPWYANGPLAQSIQVYYLGQECWLSEFSTKNCLAEWILCLHELMIVLHLLVLSLKCQTWSVLSGQSLWLI